MKMKPVTRLATPYVLLTPCVAYGLLSQVCPAIVVNCFTLSTKIEVRNV
ncbi:acid stress response protein YqgB [Mangrovibacter yixingensis]|nr:acid stress response protein YqgB [Mangrovibacter yixingensis]